MVVRICAVLCGIITATVCVMRTTHISTLNTVDWYAGGQAVSVTGLIVEEPDRRPMQTKYTIAVEAMTDGSGTILNGITGRVLVTDRRQWPLYRYNERIIATGVLEKPEQIETFYYDRYLSRFDIYSVMYRASVSSRGEPAPSLKGSLIALKDSFESQINRLYPEPHASFMAGLLTGSRRGIPEDLMEAFNQTGLTHIIAISGYNITIIIAIIGSMLFWLPQKVRFIPAVIAIVAFTIFVGAGAAVVRASIMGILGLAALQFGRLVHIRLSILWTVLFMTIANPKILWYDAGFQLSFLAVIGLTEFGPLLDRFFSRVPETLAVRESLQMTIAAQVAATPLIILLFGRFSLIAPIANLLVAPLLPLAMLFGACGTLLSYVIFPLGQLVAYLGWACLEWIIWIAKLCAAIPYASVDLTIPRWAIVAYYFALLTIYKAATSSPPSTTEQASSSWAFCQETETHEK